MHVRGSARVQARGCGASASPTRIRPSTARAARPQVSAGASPLATVHWQYRQPENAGLAPPGCAQRAALVAHHQKTGRMLRGMGGRTRRPGRLDPQRQLYGKLGADAVSLHLAGQRPPPCRCDRPLPDIQWSSERKRLVLIVDPPLIAGEQAAVPDPLRLYIISESGHSRVVITACRAVLHQG